MRVFFVSVEVKSIWKITDIQSIVMLSCYDFELVVGLFFDIYGTFLKTCFDCILLIKILLFIDVT